MASQLDKFMPNPLRWQMIFKRKEENLASSLLNIMCYQIQHRDPASLHPFWSTLGSLVTIVEIAKNDPKYFCFRKLIQINLDLRNCHLRKIVPTTYQKLIAEEVRFRKDFQVLIFNLGKKILQEGKLLLFDNFWYWLSFS